MSAPISPGERLHVHLGNLRTQNGNILTREQWIKAADDFIALEVQTTQKKPRAVKGTPSAGRPRNPLFDALALATGSRSLLEISRPMLRTVGVALADIMAVTPDLTTEEIYRRAEAFRRKHPTWTLTSTTLAKYWGDFGQKKEKTASAELDPYQEPAEWHEAAREVYPGTTITDVKWFEVSIDLRLNILKQIQRNRNAARAQTPSPHA